jgi:hypothetical protein
MSYCKWEGNHKLKIISTETTINTPKTPQDTTSEQSTPKENEHSATAKINKSFRGINVE